MKKIKKIITVFTLVMMLVAMSIGVSAATYEDYGFKYTSDMKNVIITEYKGSAETLQIDSEFAISTVDVKPIIAIDNNAFYHNVTLKEVTIEDGIQTIRNSAFEGCENLEKVTIPASVVWISADAFNGDTNLIIYGESKSFAETFASEQGIRFEVIGGAKKFEIEINKENFMDSLDIMGMGMAGMFIVAIAMALIITVMNIVFDPAKKQKKEEVEVE
jgi:hypothetical protein